MDYLNHRRKIIDRLDGKIIEILARRMMISGQIGKYKRKNGLKIMNRERENSMVRDRVAAAKKKGMKSGFTRTIFKLIFLQSRLEQGK
jgi:chorismate mutase